MSWVRGLRTEVLHRSWLSKFRSSGLETQSGTVPTEERQVCQVYQGVNCSRIHRKCPEHRKPQHSPAMKVPSALQGAWRCPKSSGTTFRPGGWVVLRGSGGSGRQFRLLRRLRKPKPQDVCMQYIHMIMYEYIHIYI